MGNKGFIRRILPFFATFAVGVFIASFFVSVGPNRGWGGRGRCRGEVERLRHENEFLREENFRLKNDSDENWTHHPELAPAVQNWDGPDMPVKDTVPPTPPRLRHR